jgi:hypothetical protein
MTQSRFAGRVAACVLALSFVAGSAQARDYVSGALKISHPWSRPTPPGAPTAAGYLTIVNTGDVPDRLVGAASPAAESVDLHRESMVGGIMSMRPVLDGLVVPAHGSAKLAPGGYHLMIISPKRPFRAGDRIPVTLRFERAGAVGVDLSVEQPDMGGGSMPGMAMPGMH